MYGAIGESNHSSGMATTEQVCHQLGLTGLQQTLILIVELQENRAGNKRFLQMRAIALTCFCSTFRKKKKAQNVPYGSYVSIN